MPTTAVYTHLTITSQLFETCPEGKDTSRVGR